MRTNNNQRSTCCFNTCPKPSDQFCKDYSSEHASKHLLGSWNSLPRWFKFFHRTLCRFFQKSWPTSDETSPGHPEQPWFSPWQQRLSTATSVPTPFYNHGDITFLLSRYWKPTSFAGVREADLENRYMVVHGKPMAPKKGTALCASKGRPTGRAR